MKQIIKTIMIAVLTAAISTGATAQEQKKQRMTREQFTEKQARFIADSMAFDDATTIKFINTYTNCQKEVWALGPRNDRPKQNEQTSKTDEQTEKMIKERFAKSQKLLDIRQKYYTEYSKFLTQKQIERVYQLEKEMMNKFAKHRRDGMKRPQHNGKRPPMKQNAEGSAAQ